MNNAGFSVKMLKLLRRNLKAAFTFPVRFSGIFSATGDFCYSFRTSGARLGVAQSDERHLKEALLWLARAQDQCEGRGVSIKYGVYGGWDKFPYPETTGYILETFLDYSKYARDSSFRDRALRAGDWEIMIQHKSGGVLSHPKNSEVLMVFNTGQVVHGWVRLFEETQERRFLDAAKRACDYLIMQQKSDGSWIKDTYDGAPRTYQTRTSWAMLRAYSHLKDERIATAALKNLDWSLLQQQSDGWFENCGLADDPPITHVIAYTLRGLLETHLLMESGAIEKRTNRYLESVVLACDGFCRAVEEHPALGIRGLPNCSYGPGWTSDDPHSCLTGNVQMAGILFKLAKITNDNRYQSVANLILDTTKRTQDLEIKVDGIRGALAGSFPFHQGYSSGYYPNWATKFMADALLMRIRDQGVRL